MSSPSTPSLPSIISKKDWCKAITGIKETLKKELSTNTNDKERLYEEVKKALRDPNFDANSKNRIIQELNDITILYDATANSFRLGTDEMYGIGPSSSPTEAGRSLPVNQTTMQRTDSPVKTVAETRATFDRLVAERDDEIRRMEEHIKRQDAHIADVEERNNALKSAVDKTKHHASIVTKELARLQAGTTVPKADDDDDDIDSVYPSSASLPTSSTSLPTSRQASRRAEDEEVKTTTDNPMGIFGRTVGAVADLVRGKPAKLVKPVPQAVKGSEVEATDLNEIDASVAEKGREEVKKDVNNNPIAGAIQAGIDKEALLKEQLVPKMHARLGRGISRVNFKEHVIDYRAILLKTKPNYAAGRIATKFVKPSTKQFYECDIFHK